MRRISKRLRKEPQEPEETQVEASAEGYDTGLFPNFPYSQRWGDFSSRSIITGRGVVLAPKYHHLLNDYLRIMNWEGLLNIPLNVYPELVRYFYNNLTIVDDPQGYLLASYVKGQHILFNVGGLAKFLGIPPSGSLVYFSDFDAFNTAVLKENDFYGTLTADRAVCDTLDTHALLSKYRVLHKFVAANVVPQGGHYNEITRLQSYVLYKIITHGSLSLPYIMMREMAAVGFSTKRSLPFGGYLTKIFTAFGVSFEGETVSRLKNPINKSSISQMQLPDMDNPHIPLVNASVQGENGTVQVEVANAPGEQQECFGFSRFSTSAHSNDGSSHISLQEVYRRQGDLARQFEEFRNETRQQFAHINGSLQHLKNLFLAYPTPRPPHP